MTRFIGRFLASVFVMVMTLAGVHGFFKVIQLAFLWTVPEAAQPHAAILIAFVAFLNAASAKA